MSKEHSVAGESSSDAAVIEKYLDAQFECAWYEFDLALLEAVGRANPVQGSPR